MAAADRASASASIGAALAAAAAGAAWFAPYAATAASIGREWWPGRPLADALNALLARGAPIELRSGALRFVDASAASPQLAYEAFIAETASVPTRDNVHDLYNAMVWLTWPALKRRLNELQAGEIARLGVGGTRGALRDAVTLLDENGALWAAPAPLAHALSQRDWRALFVTGRPLWRGSAPLLIGHALLEKLLLAPRKAVTAHTWLMPPDTDADATAIAALLTADSMARWPSLPLPLPLPVLGVPGWWPANEAPAFYDDASVFRPPRR